MIKEAVLDPLRARSNELFTATMLKTRKTAMQMIRIIHNHTHSLSFSIEFWKAPTRSNTAAKMRRTARTNSIQFSNLSVTCRMMYKMFEMEAIRSMIANINAPIRGVMQQHGLSILDLNLGVAQEHSTFLFTR
jgi:hypothetical protein